jgi:hypothetical protein
MNADHTGEEMEEEMHSKEVLRSKGRKCVDE